MMNPRLLIVVGFGCMLVGILLPFFMVMHWIESTFFLNFFAYGPQVLGLVFGMLGVGFYALGRRRKE